MKGHIKNNKEVTMLDNEIKERISICACDIDELLTHEQIEDFESTLNDLWDLFKKAQYMYTIELPKIIKAVKAIIDECTRDVDRLLTKEEISNFESTLNDLRELFKRQLHWYAIEASRIAKERNYDLSATTGPDFPEGYEAKYISSDHFELWKKAKGDEEGKMVSWMAPCTTRKVILKTVCEFEAQEKQKDSERR